MHALSAEERQTLIAMLVEKYGWGLSCPQFAELMLGLFEDIPGFECIPSPQAAQITHQLWRTYREQKEHQARVERPDSC